MALRKKKLISLMLTVIVLMLAVFGSVQVVRAVGTGATSGDFGPTLTPYAHENALKAIETSQSPASAASGGSPSASGVMYTTLLNMAGWLFYAVSAALGWITAQMVGVMIYIMNFPLNLDSIEAINSGWKNIRDVCNNFFIVLVLVIAVGQILRIPNYNRQLLPKLLVMAVLINFSKMFTGIFIDFSQIIMLEFANGLKDISANNVILSAIGLPDLYSFAKMSDFLKEIDKTGDVKTILNILTAMLFAVVITVVALVVISVISIILVYRIVMLWFLVILSPLAFLLSTFPKGQSYAGMWWSELSKYLVVGPVMVFFLYISLTVMSTTMTPTTRSEKVLGQTIEYRSGDSPNEIENPNQNPNSSLQAITKMTTLPSIINFLIVIGLMVCSLIIGQKTGAQGASWAGAGLNKLQKWGKGATVGLGQKAVGGVAKRAGTGALGASSGLISGADKLVKRMSGGRVGIGDSSRKVGQFAGAYRGDLLKSRKAEKLAKRQKFFKKLGMGDEAVKAWGGVADSNLGRGAKMAATTVAGATTLAAGATTGGLAWIPALAASAAAFSPLLKSYTAKSEKTRKSEIEDSEKERDTEKTQLKTSKDKALKDEDDDLRKKTANEQALINRNITDKSTGAGLDERVKEKIKDNNGGTAPTSYDDKMVADAKAQVFGSVEGELKRLHQESIKNINDRFTIDKESADKKHEQRKRDIGEPTWMQKKYGDYHPNKVTMDVVKRVTEDDEKTKKRRDALAGGANISEFKKSDFYSSSGQTDLQHRFFKTLSDGSDKSIAALKQMSNDLQKIQTGILSGNKITKDQTQSLIGLKQGLAAYKKAGGEMSHFSSVITDLNKIKTHDISNTNEELEKTVEDHETAIITK